MDTFNFNIVKQLYFNITDKVGKVNSKTRLTPLSNAKMLPSGSNAFLNGSLENRMPRRTFTSSPQVTESGILSAGTSLLNVGDNLSATII